MGRKYWLGAAAGALAIGSMAASSQAAPMGGMGADVKAAVGESSGVQNVHWGRRYYGGYYYAPRPYYGYGYYRPYYYYGYAPSYYYGPRHYRRGWW
jgi:hypothetical protein